MAPVKLQEALPGLLMNPNSGFVPEHLLLVFSLLLTYYAVAKSNFR